MSFAQKRMFMPTDPMNLMAATFVLETLNPLDFGEVLLECRNVHLDIVFKEYIDKTYHWMNTMLWITHSVEYEFYIFITSWLNWIPCESVNNSLNNTCVIIPIISDAALWIIELKKK